MPNATRMNEMFQKTQGASSRNLETCFFLFREQREGVQVRVVVVGRLVWMWVAIKEGGS